MYLRRAVSCCAALVALTAAAQGQTPASVRLVRVSNHDEVSVMIGNKPFASFLYSDTLTKPVLMDIRTINDEVVTRGFPLRSRSGEPHDHPHHTGLWLNYENVNGLDFWNNSYAIPAAKKAGYGVIRIQGPVTIHSGTQGTLDYDATWTDQKSTTLLNEHTELTFSGAGHLRTIDRVTTLTAGQKVVFPDAKDGFLGLRLAHELQIRSAEDQTFSDARGKQTLVKGGNDMLATGTYLTSEGKQGDSAWSTRGSWCKVSGVIAGDSVSVSILDHVMNPDYPTFWHARGYGLFAANPLGEKIFTKGKSVFGLTLEKGQSVTFRYRILITSGNSTPQAAELNQAQQQFSQKIR